MSATRTTTRQLRQTLRAASSGNTMTTGTTTMRFCQSSRHQRWYSATGVVGRSPVQAAARRVWNTGESSTTGGYAGSVQQRQFSASSAQRHGHLDPPKPGEELRVTFIDQSNQQHTFEVSAGDNLLDIAQANDLEMEGACGGSCACSTCHVIVEGGAPGSPADGEDGSAMYDRIPEAEDDENDMLDLAFGLTETSRLGCQVKMSKELDGLVVRLPSATRNLQKSDFEKK